MSLIVMLDLGAALFMVCRVYFIRHHYDTNILFSFRKILINYKTELLLHSYRFGILRLVSKATVNKGLTS